jgi:hypothetical protein
MKATFKSSLAIGLLAVTAAMTSQATVVNFSSAGLNTLNPTVSSVAGNISFSGWTVNSTVGTGSVAANGGGGTAVLSISSGLFMFNSADFIANPLFCMGGIQTAAAVQVYGFDENNVLVGQATVNVNTMGAVTQNFGWCVKSVVFDPEGANIPRDPNDGVTMSNFDVDICPVPEPASYATGILLLAPCAMGLIRGYRQKAQARKLSVLA